RVVAALAKEPIGTITARDEVIAADDRGAALSTYDGLGVPAMDGIGAVAAVDRAIQAVDAGDVLFAVAWREDVIGRLTQRHREGPATAGHDFGTGGIEQVQPAHRPQRPGLRGVVQVK